MSSPSAENLRRCIEGNSSAIWFGVVHLGSRKFEGCPAARCTSSLVSAENISLPVAAASAGHRKGIKGTMAHRRCNRHGRRVGLPERIVNAVDHRSSPPFHPAIILHRLSSGAQRDAAQQRIAGVFIPVRNVAGPDGLQPLLAYWFLGRSLGQAFLAVQLTGHDYLRSLGVELVPTSAPDFSRRSVRWRMGLLTVRSVPV